MIPRRRSRQRSRIYELIAGSKLHPTAQWVYRTLREEIPSLSLGNLYRNLNILVGEGKIVLRDCGDNTEHYDAVTEIHYHFICNACGKISDLRMPVQRAITKKAQKLTRHSITGHTINFFGTCTSCL